MEDVRPTKADAAFLQNACVVLASTQGFTLSWSAPLLWGGADKSLRHESIVVRCRCGLQGWFPLGARASRPLVWRTLSGPFPGGRAGAGRERSPSKGCFP